MTEINVGFTKIKITHDNCDGKTLNVRIYINDIYIGLDATDFKVLADFLKSYSDNKVVAND